MKKVIISKRVIILQRDKIKHFFKCDDGFMVRNLRCNIHLCKWNPQRMKLHIQIWLPLIHILRDNSKWEIGNKNVITIYH